MIIDEIKKDNVQAMKDKNTLARAIYGVVMNKVLLHGIECKKDGKEQTDADVVQILQKTIKELTEEKENYIKAGNEAEANNIEIQKDILTKYLPQMLSEDEIKNINATSCYLLKINCTNNSVSISVNTIFIPTNKLVGIFISRCFCWNW